MKKFVFSMMVFFSLIASANTISTGGVYVTLSPETYTGVSNYRSHQICAQFSISSADVKSVRVHIVVTDRNGKEVSNGWVTLTPNRNGKATCWIDVPFAGRYSAYLVQH